jgi:hypothetical protein
MQGLKSLCPNRVEAQRSVSSLLGWAVHKTYFILQHVPV